MHDPGGIVLFFLKVSSVMHSDNNQLEPFFQLSPVCRRYEIQFMLKSSISSLTTSGAYYGHGAYATLKPLPTTYLHYDIFPRSGLTFIEEVHTVSGTRPTENINLCSTQKRPLKML
jgi:hypothetical protein